MSRRSWFLFLPLYSPKLDPIELVFSKLKDHLQRIGARILTDILEAIQKSAIFAHLKSAEITSRLPSMSQVKGGTL